MYFSCKIIDIILHEHPFKFTRKKFLYFSKKKKKKKKKKIIIYFLRRFTFAF